MAEQPGKTPTMDETFDRCVATYKEGELPAHLTLGTEEYLAFRALVETRPDIPAFPQYLNPPKPLLLVIEWNDHPEVDDFWD